jgi:hypothetical protein
MSTATVDFVSCEGNSERGEAEGWREGLVSEITNVVGGNAIGRKSLDE